MSITEQNLPEWQPPEAAVPAAPPITYDAQGHPVISVSPKSVTEKDLPEWTPKVAEETKKPFTWRDTWPVQLAERAFHAAALPGDIATGKMDTQPATPGVWTDEDEARAQANAAEEYHRTMDLAQLGTRATPGRNPVGIPGYEATGKAKLTGTDQLFQPLRGAAPALPTAGAAAAATAERLGAPLPVGLASDKAAVNQVTSAAQSVPFAGHKISGPVAKTIEAAGDRIENISQDMTQGIGDRATSNAIVQPGIQAVIDNNRQAQDAAFENLRGFLPHHGEAPVHSLPRTKAAMDTVALRRSNAGEDPEFGFDNLRKIQDITSFNGALRARANAVSPNIGTKTNPGYRSGDFSYLKKPLDADLMEAVKNGAIANGKDPAAALKAFTDANKQFAELAKQNELLDSIVNAKGEGAISLLTGAAKEAGGNLKLLNDLKQQMSPEAYAHVGGTLLRELGMQKTAEGVQFSLRKFISNWESYVSPGAKQALFSPQHLRDIEDIVGMGKHLGGALKATNTSHTAGALIMFDVLKTAGEGAIAVGAGLMSPVAAGVAAGGFVTANAFTRMLARPATAAAAAKWVRTYEGLQTGLQSPARLSAFTIATRNLAHNLGVPEQLIYKSVQDNQPTQAQPVSDK